MKQYLKEKISDNQLDLKTTIVLNKAMRTFKPYETKAAKEHGLTPTQFSVLETLYSKGELRIQDLIEKMLATSGNMTVVIRRSEEHTSELQSRQYLVCRLLLEKKN